MKKLIALILSLTFVFALVGCENSSLEPEVGDIIEISYSGEILESYPAQITEVYGIKVVKEAEKYDLIPMVMVNDELYLDTGHESTVEARCGMMDGEITSTVDGTEQPTENNQSNFGSGYGYQYGSTEGTIEIYMNDKWWVFATEKVIASSELMIDTAESEANDELTDKEAFVVTNILTNETKPLMAEDGLTLSDIVESDSWNTEGTADCASNIEITLNNATYKYHSDCGTFNDSVNQRNLSLDEEVKEIVNALLAEYISLTSTDIPVE